MPDAGAAPAAVRVPPRSSAEPELAEHELTALWLLGRVPPAILPWPLLRPGRAGRGPGPDVREALFTRAGVPVSGDVEVHLRASDFGRHGHLSDPGYGEVALHLVWEDDRPAAQRGGAQPLPASGVPGRAAAPLDVPTVAVGPALGHSSRRLRGCWRLARAAPNPAWPARATSAPRP